MRRNLRSVAAVLAGAGLSLAAGCSLDPGSTVQPLETPRSLSQTTAVNGVAFDVEYYLYSIANCGDSPDCPPPLVLAGIPAMEGAELPNVKVSTTFPDDRSKTFAASAITGYDGAFVVPNTERPALGYVYAHAEFQPDLPPPAEGQPHERNWNPAEPPVPSYHYVPTTTATPIATREGNCLLQRAAVFGDAGILDAMARALTYMGNPTTVADLLNPAKYGGVLVWWNMNDPELGDWLPGFGTTSKADVGDTYVVTWSPAGTVPPEVQSPLGFSVDPSGQSLFGLSVTLLPPTTAPLTEVHLTPIDSNADAAGMPTPLHPPPAIWVKPGEVTYGETRPSTHTAHLGPVGPEFCDIDFGAGQ